MAFSNADRLPIVTVVIDDQIEESLAARYEHRSMLNVIFGSALNSFSMPMPIYIFDRSLQAEPQRHSDEAGKMTRSPYEPESQMENALWAGHCKLLFLLNTPGGYIETFHRLTVLTNRVRKAGGKVMAFGKGKVDSAGARIFMEADAEHRYLDADTNLFFHLTGHARGEVLPDRTLASMAEHRRQELTTLQTIWTNNVTNQAHKVELERRISSGDSANAVGEDIKWTFSAAEAARFWDVKVTTDALVTTYEQIMHTTNKDLGLQHWTAAPVRRFLGIPDNTKL